MEKEAGFKEIVDKVIDFFSVDISDTDFDFTEEDVSKKVEDVETEELRDESGLSPKTDKFIDSTERIPVHEIMEEEGEFQVNEYKVNIPAELEARFGEASVDHSYSVLKYLESLGYPDFSFVVNPAHRETDICDYIAGENPWELTGVLLSAEDDANTKGYPVAPIFWLTHPNSKGYLIVNPPTNVDQIPNSAPGLHMWDDDERLNEEKQRLLTQLPTVNVDRYTLAPMMFHAIELKPSTELEQEVYPEDYESAGSTLPIHESQVIDKVKCGSTWESDIKPVRVKETIFIRQPLDTVQVILKDFDGIQLETFNELSKVFLTDLERELIVPTNSLEILSLSASSDNDISRGQFVLVDDNETIGIAFGKINDEAIVYIPDFGGLASVDEWMNLEAS